MVQCDSGLNSILILSLYFNCVSILYSLSNLCSGKKKDSSKAYSKELQRLKDYYEQTNAKVIAEFYIEDIEDIQFAKMRALYTFIEGHSFAVENFNLSTAYISDDSLGYVKTIISNAKPFLKELYLSRCGLTVDHLE